MQPELESFTFQWLCNHWYDIKIPTCLSILNFYFICVLIKYSDENSDGLELKWNLKVFFVEFFQCIKIISCETLVQLGSKAALESTFDQILL